VLVSLATEELDTEYQLLHLVERSRELQGTRGAEETLTIEFSGGSFAMLLHVTSVADDTRRVDGWVAPAKPMRVSVRQDDKSWDSSVSRLGRFEFPRLPVGLSRFWLFADHHGAGDAAGNTAGNTAGE